MKKTLGKKLLGLLLMASMLFTGCNNDKKIKETKAPEVTGEVSVTVLDIGKADCSIIKTANYTMMIDTGEANNAKEIRHYLEENNITKIDYLELTHYDKDHIGGLRKLLNKGIEFGHIYAYDNEVSSSTYLNMMDKLKECGYELEYVKDTMEFTMDDVLVQIYAPMKDNYGTSKGNSFVDEETENEFSLVTKVTHGSKKFLFAGDACNARLGELPNQMDLDVDFVKYPHHGRIDNYTGAFVRGTKADYAVITCSLKNPPDQEVLAALEGSETEVFKSLDGVVTCVSDGSKLTIEQKKN